MDKLISYMTTANRLWYTAQSLINEFGKDALNEAWTNGLIEIREGLNGKVIKLK